MGISYILLILDQALLKSLSEVRMMYQGIDVSEQTFTVTFKFLYLDIYWELSENEKGKKDNIFYTETWDHSKDILPMQRPQNIYNL